MLVLSRFIGEIVNIGDDITVQVLDVRRERDGFKVRLGFHAPDGIAIDRSEIREQKTMDKTLDCGSLGHVSPDGLVQAIKRGIDSKPKNHQHED